MPASSDPQRLVNARQFLMGSSQNDVEHGAALLAPDVVYTVPGHHKLAGVFHGPDEVLRHVGALVDYSNRTFEVLRWIDWMVGETHITAYQYAQAQNGARIYRGHHLYLLESNADDRLCDIKVFFEDPTAADRFFT